MDKKRLFLQALGKFLLGVVIIGLLLFLPAGSLQYWQGWLLMGILFVPMFCAGLVMMAKNPELLRKRLNAKEGEKEQRTVVKLSGLLFVAAFVVAGLNWRFDWCVLPGWAVWVSAGLFLVCYVLYAEVLRENTYLSWRASIGVLTGACCRTGPFGYRQDCSWSAICSTRRFCGRTPTCPGPSRSRRIRRSSTRGYTESSGIRCTWPRPSCSWPCRWCWVLPSHSSSCCSTFR